MKKCIDLTHTVTDAMSVHSFDEPVNIEKIRTLAKHQYNDWRLSSGMHAGTHIDGPGHLTEAQVLLSDFPIDKFIGKGYLVDARNKEVDLLLLQDLPKEEGLIILIVTGWDKKFGSCEYFNNHPVISIEVAYEFVKRNIKMIGIDFFSPDRFPFEVHKIFFQHDILIIENLTNLENLVGIKNFNVIALPLKIKTDSALARVIAIVD